MNALELADELLNGNHWLVLTKAANTLRTIPVLEAQVEALKADCEQMQKTMEKYCNSVIYPSDLTDEEIRANTVNEVLWFFEERRYELDDDFVLCLKRHFKIQENDND